MYVTSKNFLQIFKSKVAVNLLSLFSARGFNIIIGFISILIYGVVFSKSQIAVLNTFEMVVQFIFNLFFNWSSLGIIRFGKIEFLDNHRVNYYSSLRLVIITPVFIFISILILFFRDSLLDYVAITDSQIVFFMIMYVFLLVFHGHLTSIHTAAEDHKQNVYYYCAESLVKLSILGMFLGQYLFVSAEMK